MPTLIQIVAATGQYCYAFIWNSLGQIWNGSAFESYNATHWSSYAIHAIEDASSGNYFATIPATITTSGFYSWTGYVAANNTSAVAGDAPIDRGNWQIFASGGGSADPTGLAALIYSLRALAEDNQDSHLIEGEQLGGSDQPQFPVNASNTTFRLKSKPLSDYAGAASFVWVTIVGHGAVTRTQAGFTIVDQVNGIISFSVAPDPGNGTYPTTPPNGVYVDYNFQWFSDAKYAEFLNRSANDTVAGTTDPTTIAEGLKEVMLQFALSKFWFARASQYANQYRSSGGDASEDVQTVCQAFTNLGKAALKAATDARTAYYQRQGQRDEMASIQVNYRIDSITPRR